MAKRGRPSKKQLNPETPIVEAPKVETTNPDGSPIQYIEFNQKKIQIPNPFKLDVACGQNKTPGFFGIDIADREGVDLVYDLENFPWPIPDNSVDEIVCSHYIEHTKDMMKFMNELHRIMKTGAKALILAPYYNSMRAWQDPTHTRAISEASFLYYNKDWRVANKLDHYPITADFDFSYGYNISTDWANRAEDARNFAIRHYTNVVNDIQVVLVKK